MAPPVKSSSTISKKDDKAASNGVSTANGNVNPGISLRNGPVDEMDVDDAPPHTNGATNGKRKSRGSMQKSYKEEDSDEDDVPLTKKRKTASASKTIDSDSESDAPLAKKAPSHKPPKVTAAQIGESDDSDVPLTKKLVKEKEKIEKKAEKTAKAIRAGEAKKKQRKPIKDESDDEVPLAKKKTNGAKATNGVKKEAASKAKSKAASPTPAKKGKGKVKAESEEAEAEAEEEEYRWWEDPSKGDGTIKWTTLEHNGVVFPPPYEPLPKNVKFWYDGKPVDLALEAEEIATFYGSMLNSTVNVENLTFNANFFKDFKDILDKTGHGKDKDGNKVKITDFKKCDFSKIFAWFDSEREKKKALPAAEKKELKAKKDALEEPYMYCQWDGRKQKVGNFRVEPPSLFRGRGEHPKTGRVKRRVQPEQITINCGKDAKVPAPPEGHKWKEVKHDQTGTWLAMWQENINGAYKYVMLAANSDIKGQSDYKKFEKARELKKHIDRIRKEYTKELKSEVMADRQRATAMYLIDKFALRAGNEKGEDEADTVGCCSLKFEHVTLRPPTTVIFDFLGKDSIRFYDEVEVDEQVFKNLKIFKKSPKGEGDEIFDRLTTSGLNKHLSSYMQGLTAKVFRTYNASWTMSNLLKDMKADGTIPEKVKAYNDANRKVAILCNHKRTVAAGHAGSIEKMEDKINGLRYQQWRLKMMMLDLEPKLKKKRGADFFEKHEELTDEWVEKHIAAETEALREKIRKKFAKENEKLVAEGEKEMKAKELEERLKEATDFEKKYKKEHKSKKVEAEGKGPTVEKLEANLDKLNQRIETAKVQMEDKESNKEVALGTSKIVSLIFPLKSYIVHMLTILDRTTSILD